jgi:hypothetical protein
VDGGTFPMTCQTTTHLLNRGSDAIAGTTDDKFATPKLCSGSPCTTNDDCRPDGGGNAVCAVELSPSNPFSAVVLRCKPPTPALLLGGAPCNFDTECQSGACGYLQPPSTGSGRACFEACNATSTCPASTMCRVGGLRIQTAQGIGPSVDSCAP